MADVSTDTKPAEPGTYRLVVKDIEERVLSEHPKRVAYNIQSNIYNPGDEASHDKPVWHFINIHNKQGELLKFGLAHLKRYFEAIAPDYADDPDADTDALLEGHFMAEVYIDSYTKPDAAPGTPPRLSNRLNEISIRQVE
jgi:hypothetical protein